ncbi:MAG: hypothetical protein R2932_43710 [Caldilineaceae bacterium]
MFYNPLSAALCKHHNILCKATPPWKTFRHLLLIGAAIFLLSPSATPSMAQVDDDSPTLDYQVFLPVVQSKPAPLLPVLGIDAIRWDPRLTVRGATLVPAAVTAGQGYWRLVEAKWYDRNESQGRHHILLDILNSAGERQIDFQCEDSLGRWGFSGANRCQAGRRVLGQLRDSDWPRPTVPNRTTARRWT